jgi:hypothetical protein
VGFHTADEVGAGNGFDGAGAEGFGGSAVEIVLVESGEAEDIARAGDAEEEETAIYGGGGDLDAPGKDDEEVVGGETFAEQSCVGFVATAESDGVKVAQGVRRERTGVLWIGRKRC